MLTCADCQNLLLTYLYDLVTPEDHEVILAHTQKCEACRTALARAQSHQRILARAAKAEFAGVRFVPPPLETAQAGSRTLSLPRRPRRWQAWAIAASLLLAGLGSAGGWWGYQVVEENVALAAVDRRLAEARSQEELTQGQHRQAAAETQERVRTVAAKIQELQLKQETRLAALEKDLARQQLNLTLSGPATLQPGAPNEYQVETRSLDNRPAAARLAVRVVNQRRDVVYERMDLASTGDYRLVLPPTLPLKPQDKLSLEVLAKREGGATGQVREELTLAPPLYLTHVATDKPMYRPGETVHFRSLTLERFSLTPTHEDLQLVFIIANPNGEEIYRQTGLSRLLTEQGQQVLGPDMKPVQGIGAGEQHLDPALKGGEYTLTVREINSRFAPQERKFLVNEYQNPRLNKELDFTRKSYGPGDEVVASCKVSRVEGGAPVARRSVGVVVQIDGQKYDAIGNQADRPFSFQTDDKGAVDVHFKLPSVISRGLGTVSLTFEDGGSIESLVRPIPIVLKKLQMEFFPEGGDLIAGVANRVYFQARTTLDKPAEIHGQIVDDHDAVAADGVQTLHDDRYPGVNQGMGVFTFTPQSNRGYQLKMQSPAGIEGVYMLPKAKEEGVVLTIPDGVGKPGDPLRALVRSVGKDRTLMVGAYCRGRLMDHRSVEAKKGEVRHVELRPVAEVGGVYRVTVFEEREGPGVQRQLTPVAERLVYRKPQRELHLTCAPAKKDHVPGDKVHLSLRAFTEREEPAAALLMVAVVDKSVITMADEKTYRGMPTHYFLATEIRRPEDLEFADFLLSSKPEAAKALDLLLGTQGWRRFAEQDPGYFRQQYANDADRLLVTIGQSPQKAVSLTQTKVEKLKAELEPELTKLEVEQARANDAVAKAQNLLAQRDPQLAGTQALAQQERGEIQSRLSHLWDLAEKARLYGLVGLGALVLLGGLISLAISSNRSRAAGISIAGVVCCLLAIVTTLPWQLTTMRESLSSKLDAEAKVVMAEVERAPQIVAGIELQERAKENAPVEIAGGTKPKMAMAGAGGWMPGGVVQPPAGRPQPLRLRGLQAPVKAGCMPTPDFLNAKQAEEELKENLARRAQREGALQNQNGVAKLAGDKPAGMVNLNFAFKQVQQNAKGAGAQALDGFGMKDLTAGPMAPPQAAAAVVPKIQLDKGLPLQINAEAEHTKMTGAIDAKSLRGEMDRFKRRLGGFGGKAEQQLGQFADRQVQVLPTPLIVREYAHVHPAGANAENRTDFVDTVYWQPALVLPNGHAEVSFDLCDSVTSYQVAAFGHTTDGRLGALNSTIEARLPFTLEPKLPIEVTASDKIDVPVSIANNTSQRRQIDLRVSGTNLLPLGEKAGDGFSLAADARARRVFRFRPTIVEGQGSVEFTGNSDAFHDRVTRSFRVVPDGFPINGSVSDLLEKAAEAKIVLPPTWIGDTFKLRASVYPSTLADLQKGLEALLREPGGCFEQTSSSNYPNVLILDYLKENKVADAQVERRARNLLASGYQKLTAFECLDPGDRKKQGYEWFGGAAPPHEALTAYGLLEFNDMARVFEVDQKMVERTRHYLLRQRDGQGGFKRNPRAIDSFGRAPEHITNAYIVWTLTESGKDDDLDSELKALALQAKDSTDPYFLSLVALSHINRGQMHDVLGWLNKVAQAQQADGHLSAAQTSITGSGGRDLDIETTALAVLAWLKANRPADFNVPLQKSIKWIGQQRGGYGAFGSTQSTILALKALIAYTRAHKQAAEDGEIRLVVNERTVARQSFRANEQDALLLEAPEPEKVLHPGSNKVRLELSGKSTFPYTLAWSYNTLKPANADQLPVRLKTQLDRKVAEEGEPIHLTVTVENTQGKGQGMAVAIIGLPAGVSLPEDMKQLKEHARLRNNGTERGLISAWETRGRELILYWRDLAPKQKIEVPLEFVCRVPGEYRGSASRAYLYYNSDLKHWVEPLAVTIKAKRD